MRAEKIPTGEFEVHLVLSEHEACELHDYLMQRSTTSEQWRPKSSETLRFEDHEKLFSMRDKVFETLREVLK